LRVKGIDDEQAPPLTYSGPSEDGSAQVQREGAAKHTVPPASRRERREAARKQSRTGGPRARRG
jgi:preprotein translocase subunit SecA